MSHNPLESFKRSLIDSFIDHWFKNWRVLPLMNINNSRHLAWKYARIFVSRHYLFREANSFLWALRNRWCPRTNFRAYFRAKWGLFCLLSFKSFSQLAQFWKCGIYINNSRHLTRKSVPRSVLYFRPKWRLLSLLSFKSFSQRPQFSKLGNILGYSTVLAGEYSVTWRA